jgi:hypothetical protein
MFERRSCCFIVRPSLRPPNPGPLVQPSIQAGIHERHSESREVGIHRPGIQTSASHVILPGSFRSVNCGGILDQCRCPVVSFSKSEGSNTEKVVIAEIGIEGGGITIYGSKTDGVWSFWTEGSSMHVDSDEDEVWRSWSSELASSLDLVMLKGWPIFYPVKIHSDCVDWIRTNYDPASMPEDQLPYQQKDRHGR